MPDAEVEVDGRRVAVEVELTQKQTGRVEQIVSEMLGRYDAVWYFAGPAPGRQLRRLKERHKWAAVQILDVPDAGCVR